MTDFLAEQVDRHTDDMPKMKKMYAVILIVVIAVLAYWRMK